MPARLVGGRAARDPARAHPVEVGEERRGVGVAILGRLAEQARDDARHGRGDAPGDQRDHRARRLALAARNAEEALVEDPPQRVEVGARVDAVRGVELLGRRVASRAGGVAHAEAADRRREAEVDEPDLARHLEDDVAWLHVAVNEADLVHRSQGVGELAGEVERLHRGQGPVQQPIGERLAVDELHDDVRQPVRLADLENARQPGVPHAGEGQRLAVDPAGPFPARMGDLQRAACLAVPRLVDHRVRSVPELLTNLEPWYPDARTHGRDDATAKPHGMG